MFSNKILYILLLLCTAFVCSCSSSNSEKSVVKAKPQSAPYELLLVADKAWLQTEAGVALMEVLKTPIAGLPQVESNFKVTVINPSAFNKTFKAYSNIVMAEVSSKNTESAFSVAKDEFCSPQLIVKLSAKDNASFIAALNAEWAEKILKMFNDKEIDREKNYLKTHYSGKVKRQSENQFGVSINVPEDVDDIKKGDGFFWASASKQEFRTNVCVYSLEFDPSAASKMDNGDFAFDVSRFVELRDSVMKVNIPGGREGQWMETDARTVVASPLTIDDKPALEVRGLWDMRNDAMGGPFISHMIVDSINSRLLVTEAFVFAPEEKKRSVVKSLEASLHTLKILKK